MTRQFLHGFLDLCLLAMLDSRPDYGYGLSQRLAAGGVAEVPGGTLYPALLRLEQQGLVEASWAASDAGPRRKYYALTPAGRESLAGQTEGWRAFRDGVDGLISGAVSGGVPGGPPAAGVAGGAASVDAAGEERW
jgi:PadR family transcriptional regulator PadR